jgi:hypothetical protein
MQPSCLLVSEETSQRAQENAALEMYEFQSHSTCEASNIMVNPPSGPQSPLPSRYQSMQLVEIASISASHRKVTQQHSQPNTEPNLRRVCTLPVLN